MNEALSAETISIAGHGGDEIEAYLALPVGSGQFGSVVVIHHMPGYDSATKEITRKFAAYGYAALMPNLYHREAPGASPDDAAAIARANGGVPDERLVGDAGGAAEHLRALPGSNGKVGVIGYCSGGRQSFLAACSLQLDAAVDCYGACVVNAPPAGMPLKVTPIVGLSKDLSCPLLGLFGADDQYPRTRRDRRAVAGAPGAGQAARVPHLRERRPCLLLGQPARLPGGGGQRRVGEDLGLLRPLPGQVRGSHVHLPNGDHQDQRKRQGR